MVMCQLGVVVACGSDDYWTMVNAGTQQQHRHLANFFLNANRRLTSNSEACISFTEEGFRLSWDIYLLYKSGGYGKTSAAGTVLRFNIIFTQCFK